MLIHIIALLTDFRMFYIRYPTMHKEHMHPGAIRQLLYGHVHVREIFHTLKLVDYLPVHTHKPCNNVHLEQKKNEFCYGSRK